MSQQLLHWIFCEPLTFQLTPSDQNLYFAQYSGFKAYLVNVGSLLEYDELRC